MARGSLYAEEGERLGALYSLSRGAREREARGSLLSLYLEKREREMLGALYSLFLEEREARDSLIFLSRAERD